MDPFYLLSKHGGVCSHQTQESKASDLAQMEMLG